MSKISYSNPFTKEQYNHLVDIIVDAFIDMERRIEADLRYQNEWSLKLDIKILIMTIISINSKNAY